jgi:hypothetical protein
MKLGKYNCSDGLIKILYTQQDLIVRTSIPKDWIFVDHIQKQNSYAIGFFPRSSFEKSIWGGGQNNVLLICEKNADPVGYLMFCPGRGAMTYAKMQQMVIRNDARRLDYGSALIFVAKDFATMFGLRGFTLRCRIDLDANHFWRALGFIQYGIAAKGSVNHAGMIASNDINLYKLECNNETIPLSLF